MIPIDSFQAASALFNVNADSMAGKRQLVHGSLFSGIGGFDLAAGWCGWKNAFHCEINEFCNRILQFYWPKAASIKNIVGYDWKKWKGKIDILSGGFPCQPFSLAGKRKGTGDERHLWPAMLGAIRDIRPKWLVGENVRGIISWNEGMVFEQVHAGLEAEGYEVQTFVLPAAGVGAPHRRERVFFVAHAAGKGGRKSTEQGWEEFRQKWNALWKNPSPATDSRVLADAAIHRRSRYGKRPQVEAREQGSETSGQLAGGLKGLCLSGDAAYAACQPGEWCEPGRQSKAGGKEKRQPGRSNCKDAAANADNQGLQGKCKPGKHYGQATEPSDQQPAGCICEAWEDFPTQPPVCGGDDGISRDLDGITFSRWRNQSLQCYGNAVVPQVAYQIFTCIDTVMNL